RRRRRLLERLDLDRFLRPDAASPHAAEHEDDDRSQSRSVVHGPWSVAAWSGRGVGRRNRGESPAQGAGLRPDSGCEPRTTDFTPETRLIREVTHEAAAAVRVIPARVQALTLEFMAESVGGLYLDGRRQRRVGDNLIAAGMVALIQRARDDLSD